MKVHQPLDRLGDVYPPRGPTQKSKVPVNSEHSSFDGPSAATSQIQDGRSDRGRQAMPVCDQIAECLVLPAVLRPALWSHFITI